MSDTKIADLPVVERRYSDTSALRSNLNNLREQSSAAYDSPILILLDQVVKVLERMDQQSLRR
jgi:hypothetical protein